MSNQEILTPAAESPSAASPKAEAAPAVVPSSSPGAAPLSDDAQILSDLGMDEPGEAAPSHARVTIASPDRKKEEKPEEKTEENIEESKPEGKDEGEEKPAEVPADEKHEPDKGKDLEEDKVAELAKQLEDLKNKLAEALEAKKTPEKKDDGKEEEPALPEGWQPFTIDLDPTDYDLPTERSLASATVKVASEIETIRQGMNYLAQALVQVAQGVHAQEFQSRASTVMETLGKGAELIEAEYGRKVDRKELAKTIHQYSGTIEGELTPESVKEVWARANYKLVIEQLTKKEVLTPKEKGADQEKEAKPAPEPIGNGVPSGKRTYKNDDEEILAALSGELK